MCEPVLNSPFSNPATLIMRKPATARWSGLRGNTDRVFTNFRACVGWVMADGTRGHRGWGVEGPEVATERGGRDLFAFCRATSPAVLDQVRSPLLSGSSAPAMGR